MKRVQFNNGLVARAERIPGKRKIQLYVGIDAGSKNETPEKAGAAHLLEHMMFQTNEFRTGRDFKETGEFNGIDMNASTSATETELDFYLPSEKQALALELAYQAIASRTCEESEFQNEKDGPVTAELISVERSPASRFAHRVILPELYKGNSALEKSVIGTLDSLHALTSEEILRFKEAFYVPNSIVIVATGAVEEELFFSDIEKTFGSMQQQPVIQPDLLWKLKPRTVAVEFPELKDLEDPRQDRAMLWIGYRVSNMSHSDLLGLDLIETVLGTGLTSYLFQELREKRGIGYNPGSSYSSRRGTAMMELTLFDLHPTQLEEAIETILAIVKNLSEELLPEKIFEGKKTQSISQYATLLDSTAGRAKAWLTTEFEKPFYSFDDIPEKIKEITRQELREIAARNFSKNPLIIYALPSGYK